jgi:hypothetical protein
MQAQQRRKWFQKTNRFGIMATALGNLEARRMCLLWRNAVNFLGCVLALLLSLYKRD